MTQEIQKRRLSTAENGDNIHESGSTLLNEEHAGGRDGNHVAEANVTPLIDTSMSGIIYKEMPSGRPDQYVAPTSAPTAPKPRLEGDIVDKPQTLPHTTDVQHLKISTIARDTATPQMSDAGYEWFRRFTCAVCLKKEHDAEHKLRKIKFSYAKNPTRCGREMCQQLFRRLATEGYPGPCPHKASHASRAAPELNSTARVTHNSIAANTPTMTTGGSRPTKLVKLSAASITAHMGIESQQRTDAEELQDVNAGRSERNDSSPSDILDTYEKKNISDIWVVTEWEEITKSIFGYDRFVRGVASSVDTRNALRFMDESTPLFDLRWIRSEMEPEQMYGGNVGIIQLLRNMFDVPPNTKLLGHVGAQSSQLSRMTFSPLLRGVLAYLLYQNVFSDGNHEYWDDGYEQPLKTLYGEQQAAKIIQYCRHSKLQQDSCKASLASRAQFLAECFYNTMHPLTYVAGDFPTNSKQAHIRHLDTITRRSQHLASELRAYEGTFSFKWPSWGARFDPDVFNVDDSQEAEFKKMSDADREKQEIAFVLMPAIQRTISGEERVFTYAKGLVLLRTPFSY